MARNPAGSRPTRTVGAVDEPQLRALVDTVGAGLDLSTGDPAQLIRIRTGPGEPDVEIGFRPLEPGAHPLDALIGFDAPADWAAIGVACTGRARHVDHPGTSVPVAIVQLVSRGGAWASWWAPLGGTDGSDAPAPAEAVLGGAGTTSGSSQGGATGRVDDALRRSLALPTPRPTEGTARLWASQWLDALLTGAALEHQTSRRRRTLPTLVAAHPAADAFDLDPLRCTVAELIGHGTRLAVLRSWPQLRRACAGGRWTHHEIGPAAAAWLDDGAFARWLLGAYPDLADLRGALGELLAPSALSVIDDALAAWSLTDPKGVAS